MIFSSNEIQVTRGKEKQQHHDDEEEEEVETGTEVKKLSLLSSNFGAESDAGMKTRDRDALESSSSSILNFLLTSVRTEQVKSYQTSFLVP